MVNAGRRKNDALRQTMVLMMSKTIGKEC